MKFLIKLILIVLFFGAALFSRDVATITGLKGKVFVERDGQNIEVNLGDRLQEKDTVTTASKAKVQIIFKDDTIITIGKNSNFSINEYLFEENQESVAKFAILKGAMRTITGRIGKIAPDKFSVVAKTATIGIRGTNFTILLGEDDTIQVYCAYGAISVVVDGVEHIVKQGYYITVFSDGKIEIKSFTSLDLKDMKKKNFGKSELKKDSGVTSIDTAQLDNMTEDGIDIIINDISESVADSEQTSDIEEEHHHSDQDDYQEPYPDDCPDDYQEHYNDY
ncbi:MAG: FecR domain-containing protein [Sulfurimonas sp.]|nr:FecR domain-containing protein [Sulfurimonas sp.]